MTPALRRIRRETHFVKPDGEGLARSINNLDGKEIKLVRQRWSGVARQAGLGSGQRSSALYAWSKSYSAAPHHHMLTTCS